MYGCKECGEHFDFPKMERICFETEYGVSDLFDSRTYTDKFVCPYCESEEVEDLRECDRCNEYFFESELAYTEDMVNGGVGYLCEQCLSDCEIVE